MTDAALSIRICPRFGGHPPDRRLFGRTGTGLAGYWFVGPRPRETLLGEEPIGQSRVTTNVPDRRLFGRTGTGLARYRFVGPRPQDTQPCEGPIGQSRVAIE